MSKSIAGLSIAIAALAGGACLAVMSAQAQACSVGEMRTSRNHMLNLATQCHVSGGLLNSISEGYESSNPSPSECRARRPVDSQRSGFDECAVVYLCAAQAYNYAIRLTEQGTNCEQARLMGLEKYPVQ